MSLDQIVSEALRLSERDRAALAAALMGSLDSESTEDAAAAWDAGIERRLRELDAGTVTTVPWAEARRRIADR